VAELAYYLGVYLIALPCALVRVSTATVFCTWAIGQLAWAFGSNTAMLYLAIHLAAYAVAGAFSRGCAERTIAALFVPLVLADLAQGFGLMNEYHAWWTRTGIGSMQLIVLIASGDWLRSVILVARRARDWVRLYLMEHAPL
jgi:hypothetical protein